MLARSIGDVIRRGRGRVFAAVAPTFAEADIAAANLECVISTGGTPAPRKGFHFLAPPAAAGELARAGIDVVSLANNHTLDWGVPALLDTLERLDAEGIAYAGAGGDRAAAREAVIVERNGLRVAFLSYLDHVPDRSGWRASDWAAGPDTPGLAIADPEIVAIDVAEARRTADVVVVSFHAGFEGDTTPSTRQRELARSATGAGAALVLGSHPHILQPGVLRGRSFVAYSLGNFVFDGFTPPFHDSAILDVTLTRDGVADVRWIPVLLEDGIPRLASGRDAERILRRVDSR